MKQAIALVTGASSGIGEALARALAARGTHVVLVARSATRLEEIAREIRQAGGAATVLPADLSRPGAAQHVHDEVARRALAVDVLVNNAGIGHYGPFEAEPLEHLAGQVQINVVSARDLQEALLHPEAHRSLVVRVGGYSAYFTSLDPDIQRDVLARTTQEGY